MAHLRKRPSPASSRMPRAACLPGVTVEAASPVLIEKVRSVVTDDTGQYRIVDLRPGTYSVTFSLPGFSTVKRDGIELSGTFVATINADLKVGALEETITVTGETPIVDVQSAKTQQTVSKDVLTAIPRSRNAAGIQALIPGMSTADRFRRHLGRADGRRGDHPRRPRGRFAHLCRRHQHGLGGRQRRRRKHAAGVERAGSGADHLGRSGRSGNERRDPKRDSARRKQQLQRTFSKKDVFAVFDISQPSANKRFYLLDFTSGQVTAHFAAHGKSNGPHARAIKFKGFQRDRTWSRWVRSRPCTRLARWRTITGRSWTATTKPFIET